MDEHVTRFAGLGDAQGFVYGHAAGRGQRPADALSRRPAGNHLGDDDRGHAGEGKEQAWDHVPPAAVRRTKKDPE